jgi:hypothetical protein
MITRYSILEQPIPGISVTEERGNSLIALPGASCSTAGDGCGTAANFAISTTTSCVTWVLAGKRWNRPAG